MKTLAFDLGTSSIGWAYVDEDKSAIIGMGVRIFPEGVVDLGKGDRELSKNAQRRMARQVRRQHYRKVMRKQRLLKALMRYDMTPFTIEDITLWDLQKEIPQRHELNEWFKLNPYELRAKALLEELSLMELGRVFYHLNQRRGYISNSRNAGSEKEDGVLQEGDSKTGKTGMNETRDAMNSGTLGTYLNSIHPKVGESFTSGLPRIRNRYTDRNMYTDEFDAIYTSQQKFHPVVLDEKLRQVLGGRLKEGSSIEGVLFFQRPLRSQKGLIGKCTFEPSKPKAHISCLEFQEARVLQFVNTIECNGEKLNESEKNQVTEFLICKVKVKFSEIKKLLKKVSSSENFNYEDDHQVVGSEVIKTLSSKNYFGKKWFDFNDKEKEDIWHVLYFFDDKTKLQQHAIVKWGLSEENALILSKYRLPSNYASLSRKALRNILPFLRLGLTYDLAVVLGGVKNAFGSKWDDLSEDKLQFIIDTTIDIARSGSKGGFIDLLKSFLTDEFKLTDKELTKLYHHSQTKTTGDILDKLPVGKEADKEIMSIRNPVVVQALFELRKVYNSVTGDFGKPDMVKVELARDLKSSRDQRYKIRRENQAIESMHDRIKDELRANNIQINHESILKYRLWEECQHTCPYTGKQIGLTQLYSGEVQIEHIFPWSRSLDDSFNNKTLCFAKFNLEKGNKTPFEYYSSLDEQSWIEVKNRALKLFHTSKEFPKRYNKFKRFVQESFDDDLASRHLNDTRYISLEAKSLLEKVAPKVMVAPGTLTAKLRHMWGLNNVLSDDNLKNREDHRHHAIDALVLACFKPQQLNVISRHNRYRASEEDTPQFKEPWKNFHTETTQAVNGILVSHKKSKKTITRRLNKAKKDSQVYANLGIAARGQLHKETIFGKRTNPNGEVAYHVRVPLESITSKNHIDKIVDQGIRRLIEERIEQLGGYEGSKFDKVPNSAFFTYDSDKNERIPMIWLNNSNGDKVPVYKVRKSESISNAVPLKEGKNQYVNPRNNHHVLLYKNAKGEIEEDVISFWTAVERKRKGEQLYQVPENTSLVSSLETNETFLLGLQDEKALAMSQHALLPHLFRVQKISSFDYNFRHVNESTILNNDESAMRRIRSLGEGKGGWLTHNPIKVKISASGKIEFL